MTYYYLICLEHEIFSGIQKAIDNNKTNTSLPTPQLRTSSVTDTIYMTQESLLISLLSLPPSPQGVTLQNLELIIPRHGFILLPHTNVKCRTFLELVDCSLLSSTEVQRQGTGQSWAKNLDLLSSAVKLC